MNYYKISFPKDRIEAKEPHQLFLAAENTFAYIYKECGFFSNEDWSLYAVTKEPIENIKAIFDEVVKSNLAPYTVEQFDPNLIPTLPEPVSRWLANRPK